MCANDTAPTPPAGPAQDAPPDALALREAARASTLQIGISRSGFTTADPLGDRIERRRTQWLAEGRAGAMQWLERDRPRRTHPDDLLPGARTAVVVLAGYYDGDHDSLPAPGGCPRGKVARYAWGRDYHHVMRERLDALGAWLADEAARREAPDVRPVEWRACVDSAPLDERALAVRAGLGFIGKNTLLLTPDAGSYALIGVLLTTLALPPDAPLAPSPTHSCGGCRRCIEACPTGAIDHPYRLDPRRCTSYLTIEQRGSIPPDLAARMGDWVFGCDTCQEVCPFNTRPLARLLPELAASEGAGPWFGEADLAATPTGKSFQRRWAHTPLARTGLKGMERNLRRPRAAQDAPEPDA